MLLLLLCAAGAAAFRPLHADFNVVSMLEQAGANQLALATLRDQQPSYASAPSEWLDWIRYQLDLLHRQQRWTDIYALAGSLPYQVDAATRREINTYVVRALVAEGKTREARRVLRELIWDPQAGAAERRIWRQWVISSYLHDGREADAASALRRYANEYPDDSVEWLLLQARAELLGDNADMAVHVLSAVPGEAAQLLRWRAQAARDGVPDATLVKQVQAFIDARQERPQQAGEDLFRAWSVAARLARARADLSGYVTALEQALNRESIPADPLFTITVNELVEAYRLLAENVGNRHNLVIGDDAGWEKLAASQKRNQRQRAIYFLLATNGQGEPLETSLASLVTSLLESGLGFTAYRLLTDASLYDELESVPSSIRYPLGSWMASHNHIQQAARLYAGIVEPPPGVSAVSWDLNRARVALYSGDVPTAVQLLDDVLQQQEQPSEAFISHVLQLVFDLQTLEKNQQALRFLDDLYPRSTSPRQRREMLFWMADSQAALGNYPQAAVLYLRSAYYPRSDHADMWAISSLYKAAENAARGGMTMDAENLYNKLIAMSDDESRKALLKSKIQQLWLMKNATRQ